MITILHGDDILQSRNARNQLITSYRDVEIIHLDGKGLDKTTLVQSLESNSLFSVKRLVVIENLLSSLRSPDQRKNIIDYLKKGTGNADIIVWEGKPMGKYLIGLKKQPGIMVQDYRTPSILFKFVDSVSPHAISASLLLLRETVSHTVPEVIFTMLVRQFRLLLAISSGAMIEEAKKLAPWQQGKFKKQASYFTANQLRTCYRELMLIDFRVKTGRSPFNLTKQLEQFIMNSALYDKV